MRLDQLLASYGQFCGTRLTATIATAEAELRGSTTDQIPALLTKLHATEAAMAGAGELKRLANQVHMAVHALGILLCLPHILEDGEVVEDASLGAGNTGRHFDLETNRRVAEFKFTTWRGGSETIRQNGIFKDYFALAEHPTRKRKYLYVLGTTHTLKFLSGRRALSTVLKDGSLAKAFRAIYPHKYTVVREYYTPRAGEVIIEDISQLVPSLADLPRGIAM